MLCFTLTSQNINDTGKKKKKICSLNYFHPYGGAGEAELCCSGMHDLTSK